MTGHKTGKEGTEPIYLLYNTNGPRDVLHHTLQSSSCCAQSWTLSVISRRQSSVVCWQHLATIDVPSRNCSQFRGWGELQRELFEIFEFRICLINILQLQGALYRWPNDCIDHVTWPRPFRDSLSSIGWDLLCSTLTPNLRSLWSPSMIMNIWRATKMQKLGCL